MKSDDTARLMKAMVTASKELTDEPMVMLAIGREGVVMRSSCEQIQTPQQLRDLLIEACKHDQTEIDLSNQ